MKRGAWTGNANSCPACGTVTDKLIYSRVNAGKGVLVTCFFCDGGAKPQRDNAKFDKFALPTIPAQALPVDATPKATPRQRMIDSVEGDICRVYAMGAGDWRNKKVRQKIAEKLRTDRYEILQDDGWEVVARAIRG